MDEREPHGGPGGFEPALVGDGNWAGDFIEYPLPGNTLNAVNGTSFGNYSGQYLPPNPQVSSSIPPAPAPQYSPQQQLGSNYPQTALRFDVGHASNIQTGRVPNGASQGFAAGRSAPFSMPQNGYSQGMPEVQSHWHGGAGGHVVNDYHSHPSLPNQTFQPHVQNPNPPVQLPQQRHLQNLENFSHQHLPHQNPNPPVQFAQHHQLQDLGNLPHPNPPHQSPPHPNPPHQTAPHQNPPHQGLSHQNPPHQGLPHQNVPQQSVPHQSVSHQSVPHQSVPRQITPQNLPHQGHQPVVRQAVQPSSTATPVVRQANRPAGSAPTIGNRLDQQPAPRSTTSTSQVSGSQITVPDPYLKVDESLLARLRDGTATSWEGAKHLVVETAPEPWGKILKQQMVPVYLRTDKRRLFPERSFSIPSESLGRHIEAYLPTLKEDPAGPAARAKRAQLDSNLRRDLDRSGHDLPERWPAKLEKKVKEELKRHGHGDDILKQPPSLSDDEVVVAEREAAAILDIPPGWQPDAMFIEKMADEFGKFLKIKLTKLRAADSYRALPKAIKENSRKPSPAGKEEIRVLRSEIEPLRKVVERIVVVALDKGDPRVLKAVGERMSVAPLFQTIINMINCSEHNAPLVKAVLRLFTYFTTLTFVQLEECKFPAARARLQEQGDDEVKSSLAKIVAIAKGNGGHENSKLAKSSSDSSTTSKLPSAGMAPKPDKGVPTKPSSGSSSSKRPSDDDGETRASKKVATETKTAAPHPGVKTVASKAPSSSSQPTTATLTKPRPSTGLLPGKSRPLAKPVQKPELSKSDQLKLEPRRAPTTTDSPPDSVLSKSEVARPRAAPTTLLSSLEAAKMTRAKKTEPPKAEFSQQGPSKFAALMAEIAEPKKVKPASPTPTRSPDPTETPQERARRLRKEERRKRGLRVSFKEGSELTSVRIFEKEAAEDEGREDSMILDAGDDKAEGNHLKKSRSGVLRPWKEPTLIDFSVIVPDKRMRGEAYWTRGGKRTFTTDHQKFMEERENTTLMVIYTDPGDIPATPKSPPREPEQPVAGTTNAGLTHPEPADKPKDDGIHLPDEPEFDEIRQRWSDMDQYGPQVTSQRLLQRIEEADRASKAEEMVALANEKLKAAAARDEHASQEERDQNVFKLLSSQAAKKWVEPEPNRPRALKRKAYDDPEVQNASATIEDVVRKLRGKPAPAQEPPDWQQDPARRAEWYKGFGQDQQEAARKAAAEQPAQPAQPTLASVFAHFNNQAPAAQPPYYSQPNASEPQNAYTQFQHLASTPAAATQPQPGAGPQAGQFNAMLEALASLSQHQAPAPMSQRLAPAPDAAQALLAALNQAQQQPGLPQASQPGVGGLTNLTDVNQAHMLLRMIESQQNQGVQGLQSGGETHYQYGGFENQGGNNGQSYASASQGYNHQPQHQRDASGAAARSGGPDQGRDRAGRRDQGDTPEHLRGINRALIGTKQCTFWARGKCNKGDKCTFRHG